MSLPVLPPLAPMLARLSRELPKGDFLYEPKWDGFRCLVFRSGSDVDLRSRNHRPLARYFPELVDAVLRLPAPGLVLDGEIVLVGSGSFDFGALMARLHPAPSRVERLMRETPASLVAFDLLAQGDEDLRDRPFSERRSRLEALLAEARPPVHLTPVTDQPELAAVWLERYHGGGVDGVVAKSRELRYEPGRRAMVKVKKELTADCVVAGYRMLSDAPVLGSLLLGLYDHAGELRHVGIASSFAEEQRRRLLDAVAPLAAPLEGHPWEKGFGLGRSPLGRLKGSAGRWTPEMQRDWIPVRPDLVCEVGYDQVDEVRFRHPARFCRWRPDRGPRSCSLEQLQAVETDVATILRPTTGAGGRGR